MLTRRRPLQYFIPLFSLVCALALEGLHLLFGYGAFDIDRPILGMLGALFGCGRKEEGYICLERAFELFRQWADIPDGTEMEAGKAFVFGGVRLVKGKGVLLLPDGSREPFEECSLYGTRIDLPYYGMTAPSGWEWFDSVRGEERFRAFVERAKALAVNGK